MLPLLRHQTKAIEFLGTNEHGGALFLPMGLGKTRIILEQLVRKGYSRVLFVTKKSILRTIACEVTKWTDLSWQVITGKNKRETLDKQIVLVNYDMLYTLREKLIRFNFDAIVLDESHCIKTMAALRTKAAFQIRDGILIEKSERGKNALIQIGQVIRDRYLLTGTSLTRGFEDWYSQFKFIDNTIMPKYITTYRAMYCPMGMFPKRSGGMYPKMLGYTNITQGTLQTPSLMDRVRPYVFSAKKEECLDLPEKTFTVETVDMMPDQKRLYKQMRDDSIAYLNSKEFVASVYLTRILKLQQIANGFIIHEDGTNQRVPGSNGKIDWLADWLPEIIKDHKVVIWTHFIESSKIVREFLTKAGINYAHLHRDMDDGERHAQVVRFQDDQNVRVFTSPATIGGYGITLHAADYAVFLDNSYNYVDREQAQDRIHRIGQTKNCHYIDLITAHSVEQGILDNLSGKRNLHALSVNELASIIGKDD